MSFHQYSEKMTQESAAYPKSQDLKKLFLDLVSIGFSSVDSCRRPSMEGVVGREEVISLYGELKLSHPQLPVQLRDFQVAHQA